MKKLFLGSGLLLLVITVHAATWTSFLDGGSLPQANGWLLDGTDPGTIVDLGGGNQGFQQSDDTANAYDEWYVVNTASASTLAARFRIDTYGGGPINLLQLTTANSSANPSPAIAVAIRDNRFTLIRFNADSSGAPVEDARLADLGPVEVGIFNEAYLYIDTAKDQVRLFWNGGLRYSAIDDNPAYQLSSGEGYAEFGASNYWPENDRSGVSKITFDWVGLGTAANLPVNLPFVTWRRHLDGSKLPNEDTPPWAVEQAGASGETIIVDFVDPFNGAANQALRVNSGDGDNDWYDGALPYDEVLAGARFRLTEFTPEGKENLLSVTTDSAPLGPAPSVALVDGRYKLWSYVESDVEILDIGPAVAEEWHTAYLHAHQSGQVKLWWDGELIFDGMAPTVNPYGGYIEWGSGSWQRSATTTVEFDWVTYGIATDLNVITTEPVNGALFHDPSAGFHFTIASPDGVAASGVKVAVNGLDRTGAVVFAGDDANREGTLGGFTSNEAYRVVLVVTELDGDTSTYTVSFDTFDPSNLMVEAEDWNVDGGGFFDNPVLSTDPGAGDSYFGKTSVEDVDHNELSTDPGASQHAYRDAVLVGTEPAGDALRKKFEDAQAQDPSIRDYNVGWVDVGEWLNYTRTIPAGDYYIHGRFASGNIGQPFEATLDKVTSPNEPTQTTTPVGTFRGGPGRGWQLYDYVPLTDAQGDPLLVTLGGVQTFRVTATAGGYNANFYMFVPGLPRVKLARSGNNLVLSWPGSGFTLQTATSIRGPWAAAQSQSNPQTVTPTGTTQFYRLTK